jgi:hypothetical protein
MRRKASHKEKGERRNEKVDFNLNAGFGGSVRAVERNGPGNTGNAGQAQHGPGAKPGAREGEGSSPQEEHGAGGHCNTGR